MRARLLLLAATCVGASACAAILGIDDGTARTADGSVDGASDDAPAAKDSGDAGLQVLLKCGSTSCNVALGEACCRTGATTFDCVEAGAKCSGSVIQCDRPEMCPPGDASVVCCGDLVTTDAGTVATTVSCRPESQCGYSTHVYLCDDAGDCPSDASCIQSTFTLPTYSICK